MSEMKIYKIVLAILIVAIIIVSAIIAIKYIKEYTSEAETKEVIKRSFRRKNN